MPLFFLFDICSLWHKYFWVCAENIKNTFEFVQATDQKLPHNTPKNHFGLILIVEKYALYSYSTIEKHAKTLMRYVKKHANILII